MYNFSQKYRNPKTNQMPLEFVKVECMNGHALFWLTGVIPVLFLVLTVIIGGIGHEKITMDL
jgi:hypothetical protein